VKVPRDILKQEMIIQLNFVVVVVRVEKLCHDLRKLLLGKQNFQLHSCNIF